MNLPGVPKAKRGREVAPPWAWTEASVWTERMLATLERGIKGGKWFSMIDKVWKMENLESPAQKVARGKSKEKADGKRCRRYAQNSHRHLPPLQEKLKRGHDQPQPVQRVWIPKMGSKERRPLGISPVEDRVVQMALRNVIEPIFENVFAPHSYGFRPGRGAKDALRRVEQQLQQGRCWVVDADIKGYFDNIPQEKLLQALAQHLSDGGVLELIGGFLKQGLMESGKGWQPTETGTPQGAVITPAVSEHIPQPPGPSHGPAGKGNGALRA
jgi:RNA-directed DNA polymerase